MNPNIMRKLATALPATLSFALIACGGGPDLEQIKADFQNPSGSVQNKDAIVASSGERTASGPAIKVAGGGVPGATLTASGKQGLAQINLRRNWEQRAQTLANVLAGRSSSQALSEAQVGGVGCEQSVEAQGAFEEAAGDLLADAALGGTKANGKASYSINLTSCSDGELSGDAKVEIEVEVELENDNTGRFAFTVKYELTNVCELKTDEKACLDGTLVMEAEAIGMENFGRLTATTAWDVAGSWTEAGTLKEASLKGGVRTLLEGGDASAIARIEVLNYVNSPEGEWSYVWSFEATANINGGTVEFECRGNDGSLTCSIDHNGGTCTASDGSSLTWTAADEAALDEEWFRD
jgi:hypothetical protein